MKSNITKYAILHAVSTAAYIVLIGLFFSHVESIFGNQPDTFMAPIFMLLLFVFSAAFCGSLVFGRPILWYVDGKKREAVQLFIGTLVSLFVLAVIAFVTLFLVRPSVPPDWKTLSNGQVSLQYPENLSGASVNVEFDIAKQSCDDVCLVTSTDVGAGQLYRIYEYTFKGNPTLVRYVVHTTNGCGAYEPGPNYDKCVYLQKNYKTLVEDKIQRSIDTIKFTLKDGNS